MGLVKLMGKITAGAAMGVALVTALPIAGPVGFISATGAAAASVFGGAAGAADHIYEEMNK